MSFSHLHTCASKDWSQISALIESWPFKPLARLRSQDSPDLFALTAGRVIRTLESDNGAAWMMVQQNRTQGFTALTMLPWDSQQLGFAAGRIDYLVAEGGYPQQHETKKALLRRVLNEANRRGIWHLNVRVDVNDLSTLHVLEETGFITVDNILTFALDLTTHELSAVEHDFTIRQATIDDSERAAQLALNIFTKDRFHSDPLINKDRADKLHAEWVRNSCKGVAADVVLSAKTDEQLLGFITCKVQRETPVEFGQMIGTIVLVGCDEKARGCGIGRALISAALDWLKQQGCDVVEVGTQLRNVPASRLYQKCGFQLVGASASLRLVLQ
ncbi:MAG TPA: GNAT family N-acetyltransferase [Pyrinomonadaceae bacterium]